MRVERWSDKLYVGDRRVCGVYVTMALETLIGTGDTDAEASDAVVRKLEARIAEYQEAIAHVRGEVTR